MSDALEMLRVMQETLRGFTAKSREAVLHAQVEAVRARAREIAPEHLLLGLLRVREAVAVELLRELSVDPEAARQLLETRMTRGAAELDVNDLRRLSFTVEAEAVLQFARGEAHTFNVPGSISTPYLLLGLLAVASPASDALRQAGVEPAAVRRLVAANPSR